LKVSKATVQSQHKAAYKLIVGEDYDPVVWAALFGGLKVGQFSSKYGSWRRPKTAMQDSVSDAQQPEKLEQVGGLAAAADHDIELAGLVSDIRVLIDKGKTNEEIAVELSMQSDRATDIVAYFRERSLDNLL
jgi:hypothetical protein